MHFRGSAIFAVAAFTFAGAANAQKSANSTTPSAAPTTNGTTNGSTNTRQPSSTFPGDSTTPQVIFISGTVVLSDGLPLPERAKIERVCSGPPRTETYTDKKGHFSFQVGQNLEMQDASSSSTFNGPASASGNTNPFGGLSGGRGASTERQLMGCDLRAVLPGFQSDMVPLS